MTVDYDRTPWKLLHPDLSLYRFEGDSRYPTLSQALVLMLHGPMTSHRTWDAMGSFLWKNGLHDLYAVDIADVQMGSSLRNAVQFVENVVQWLAEIYGGNLPIILIGHSTGGVLARRYLFKSPHAHRVTFLFSLGSPHGQTHFSYQVYVPTEDDTTTDLGGSRESTASVSLVKTPKIPQNTFVVNMVGDAVGSLFDGTVHGVFLPEGINHVVRLGHAELKHDETVMNEILACLRGERYRMQFFLKALWMRTADQAGMVGPFYFEFNEVRSPFSGIFQAAVDQFYNFDDESTPLATLAYPTTQSLASTVVRLRDLSRLRPVRRRLLAKLLDSLYENQTSIHEMQDSEGSLITLRVTTQRMPTVLRTP